MLNRHIFVKFLCVQGIYSSIALKQQLPEREERIIDSVTDTVTRLDHGEVVQMPSIITYAWYL